MQTHTYIQKLTHFPPTRIQIPPQNTQAHCEATKQKQQAAQKTPRGLAIHCSINPNRCASRRARSLSQTLKAHLNAANMFYDKWMKNISTHRGALHCIALKGQASKCRYRITRIDASVFPLWMWKIQWGASKWMHSHREPVLRQLIKSKQALTLIWGAITLPLWSKKPHMFYNWCLRGRL